jgi:hypothetical protein
MTALSRRDQHSKRKKDKEATEQREAWKDRIKPGKLLAKLEAHMDGKVELSASQSKRRGGVGSSGAPPFFDLANRGERDGHPESR